MNGILTQVRERYRDWRDASLDRRYGIHTAGIDLDVRAPGASAAHGNYYEPIQLDAFERIMACLPIGPQQFTFVDYGSGKGRALVLAAERGFGRVVGMEYAPHLHLAAERNIARFRAVSGNRVPVELQLGDATDYELPPENLVCFLYNPFGEPLIAKVLERMRLSLAAHPRRLFVVYRNPRHSRVFESAGFLRCLVRNSTFEIHGTQER